MNAWAKLLVPAFLFVATTAHGQDASANAAPDASADVSPAPTSFDLGAAIESYEYQVHPRTDDDGLSKPSFTNRQNNLRSFFNDDGSVAIEERVPSELEGFRLQFSGEDGVLARTDEATNSVVNSFPEFDSIWTNAKNGIEQQIDAFSESAPGIVEVRQVITGLTPELVDDTTVILVDDDARERVWYRQLSAFDSHANRLPASFVVAGDVITIRVSVDGDTQWPVTIDPIAQSASISLQCFGCGRTSVHYGATTAAGDIDGDGLVDLVVGVPDFDLETPADSGAVLIYVNNSGTYSSTPSWTIKGSATGQGFGHSVAVFDVNGDGYADIVVGAPGYQRDSSHANEGAVGVFLSDGIISDLGVSFDDATQLLPTVSGPNKMGKAVAGCKVNNDSLLDICALSQTTLYTYTDSTGGIPTAQTPLDLDPEDDDLASTMVPGELNKSVSVGQDVAIGLANGPHPRVLVYGVTNPVLGVFGLIESLPLPTGASSQFGRSIAIADARGDGTPDLFVSDDTSIYAYENAGTSSTKLTNPTGSYSDPWEFGTLGGLGDVNGDGFQDVAACQGTYSSPTLSDVGRCVVIGGSPSGLRTNPPLENGEPSYPLTVVGTQVNEFLGEGFGFGGSLRANPISGIDVNGDGFSDFVLGDSLFASGEQGRVQIFLGSRGGISGSAIAAQEGQANMRLGISVGSADGFFLHLFPGADVIVGAPDFDGTYSGEGAVYVYTGGYKGSTGSNGDNLHDWVVHGSQPNEHMGVAVAGARLQGASQPASVIVCSACPTMTTLNGLTTCSPNGTGKLRVFHGATSGIPSTTAYQTIDFGNQAEGYCVSLAARDNIVAVGAPGYPTGGLVKVYQATSAGSLFATDAISGAGGASAQFGTSIALGKSSKSLAQPDILIAGAPFADPTAGTDAGRVSYLTISTSGLLSNHIDIDGDQAGEEFGSAVAALDYDGDGREDLAASAPFYSDSAHGLTKEGEVALFHRLSSGGFSSSKSSTAHSNHSDTLGSGYGLALAGGDINLDGKDDIIVGAPNLTSTPLHGLEGEVFVYLGATSGFGILNGTFLGGSAILKLGASAATADFDADGFADAIYGEPGYTASGLTSEGRAIIRYGQW